MDLEQRTEGVLRGLAIPVSEKATTYLVSRHGKIALVPEHRFHASGDVKLGLISTLNASSQLCLVLT